MNPLIELEILLLFLAFLRSIYAISSVSLFFAASFPKQVVSFTSPLWGGFELETAFAQRTFLLVHSPSTHFDQMILFNLCSVICPEAYDKMLQLVLQEKAGCYISTFGGSINKNIFSRIPAILTFLSSLIKPSGRVDDGRTVSHWNFGRLINPCII